jgi:DTW domain-containing protein
MKSAAAKLPQLESFSLLASRFSILPSLMSRAVVTRPNVRCERCLCPPRWCVCDGLRTLECPVQVDVLMHEMETFRPSSTGHIVARSLPAARIHVFRPERPLEPEAFAAPGRELWVLHPRGKPMPEDRKPEEIQVLLLDGNWQQAKRMLRKLDGVGRKISLPVAAESRYWLRAEPEPGLTSTVEALLLILERLGAKESHEALRLQFELHVFAGLCVRGNKALIGKFLETSPLVAAFPEIVARLWGEEGKGSGLRDKG